MLIKPKLLILIVFSVLFSGCYVPYPSVGVGSSAYYHNARTQYRYIIKHICAWQHDREICEIVRVKVIVR